MIKVALIEEYLNALFPNAKCELFYSKDYELTIAVSLSAQTTDVATNKVTTVLFNQYPNLESLANANIKDVEEIIKSIGLYKVKAKNVIGIAKTILNEYGGKLPCDKKSLTKLPGVGNKTAGVIRAEIFAIPDFPVDTHILRISKRLGLCLLGDNPDKCEMKLKQIFPKEHWIKLHHQLIHFGRYFCTAKKPMCAQCKICEYCKEYKQKHVI